MTSVAAMPTFGLVATHVWQYTVGGKNVIRSGFNYRRKNPTGRKRSPLDEINAARWQTAWNGEFIDLLSVLTRLEPLHDAQDKLLMRILDSPLASLDQLATVGVGWPAGLQDQQRKPDYSAAKPGSPRYAGWHATRDRLCLADRTTKGRGLGNCCPLNQYIVALRG